MRLAMVGLGKMGMNMTRRLLARGHEVVAFDQFPPNVEAAAKEGAIPAASLAEAVSHLSPPRVVWLMVPAGAPVESSLQILMGLLAGGDVVVDGGNSRYRDSIPRGNELATRGIRFADVGTSGGVWGLSQGYCLMAGTDPDTFRILEPVFEALAPPGGYAHVGPHGAGHFVKMIHNGIEYGMMQAYAEGFDLLSTAPFPIDARQVADLWRKGSVIRSWMLDLVEQALRENPDLSGIAPYVEDSGEGRWTVEQAVQAGVSLPVISAALYARFASRREEPFGLKLLAAMRHGFGGHAVRTGESGEPAAPEKE